MNATGRPPVAPDEVLSLPEHAHASPTCVGKMIAETANPPP